MQSFTRGYATFRGRAIQCLREAGRHLKFTKFLQFLTLFLQFSKLLLTFRIRNMDEYEFGSTTRDSFILSTYWQYSNSDSAIVLSSQSPHLRPLTNNVDTSGDNIALVPYDGRKIGTTRADFLNLLEAWEIPAIAAKQLFSPLRKGYGVRTGINQRCTWYYLPHIYFCGEITRQGLYVCQVLNVETLHARTLVCCPNSMKENMKNGLQTLLSNYEPIWAFAHLIFAKIAVAAFEDIHNATVSSVAIVVRKPDLSQYISLIDLHSLKAQNRLSTMVWTPEISSAVRRCNVHFWILSTLWG